MGVGGVAVPSTVGRRGGESHERRGVLVDGHVVAPGDDRLDGGEELGVDGVGLDGGVAGGDRLRREVEVDGAEEEVL